MAHSNQPTSSTPPPSSGHPRPRAIVRGRKLIGNLLPSSRPKIRGGGAITPALSCSSLGIGIVLLARDKIGLATSREHDATHKSQVRTSQNAVNTNFAASAT